MAERRMFAKTVIDSDAFLDMPLSTQALYFHLSMRADDDGFINNPKKIQRTIGCSDDDIKLLIAKRFIIPFESGIVVIKHWKIHNYIQKDRYKPTIYKEERASLLLKENNAYTELGTMDTECIQDASVVDTQVSLGKDRLGKDRKEIEAAPDSFLQFAAGDDRLLDALKGFEEMRKKQKSGALTDRAKKLLITSLRKLSEDPDVQIQIIDQSTANGWKGFYELKSSTKTGGDGWDMILKEAGRR